MTETQLNGTQPSAEGGLNDPPASAERAANIDSGSEPFIRVKVGPRNSYSDPESGLRFYRWQGVDYPSVTTIRRMAGLPHGLHQWAIGKVVDHAIGHAVENALRMTMDPSVITVIRHELRRAATAERDAAAALGTAVHDAAATRRSVEEVAEELRPRLRQYLHWLDVSGAVILASEFQVWSPSVGYAGTADLLVRLPNGSTWLIDLKTGKGVWSEHALQVIAYAGADFVGNDDVVDEELTAALKSVTGIAILHLQDDHWEFRAVRRDKDTWHAWRGLLLFAVWLFHHPDPDSVTVARRRGSAS